MAGHVTKITITKAIPFQGDGDTLETRLRKVHLRGFPTVAIYKNADITTRTLTTAQVYEELYTPQPHLHEAYLKRLQQLAELFMAQGINIFKLDKAYDYIATADDGIETTWTMLPPVIEKFKIPRHPDGGFDYRPLLSPELQAIMQEQGWTIDPQTPGMDYHNDSDTFSLINDGSHRLHAALESQGAITILEIANITPGFPYYAAPQHYSTVQIFPEEQVGDLKVHVLASPGHKQLYRIFPSGGILSGDVRPPRLDEEYV
jgi:hypothetical protein